MAQLIKLKRSAVAGKVPTTGSLTSGEIAINTVDGKLYYRRDDDTIQSFFTTNALITGSLQQSGSDSYFLSNVGIGTTTPLHPLHVSGFISSSDSYINKWGSISASLAQLDAGANQTLQEVTDNGATTTNNITLSGVNRHIYFGSQNTFVGERSNSNSLELRGGGSTGTETVYIDSSGNVGLGISAPSYKLDVIGSGNFTSNLTATGSLIVQHTSNSSRYLLLGWGSIYANDANNELILGSNYSDLNSTRISISGKNSDNTPSDAISMHANNGVAIFSGSVSNYFDPQALLHVAGDAKVEGSLTLDTIDYANTDTDIFLVSDGGVVKGRTGVEVASDIGAITTQPTLQNAAAAGNTITGSINVGIGVASPTRKLVVSDGVDYQIRAKYPYDGRYLDIGYQALDVANPYDGNFQIKIDGETSLFVGTDVASSGSLASGKNLFVKTLANATTDTNRFLVGDHNGVSHEVKYRTGAQLLSDIGAAPSTINLQNVTDNGNVTTNDIIAAKLSGSSLGIIGNGQITGDLVVGGIVTAQEFHTEFVSASIIYQSGSTKFGDTSDDKHAFTGSVSIKDVPNADGDRDKFLVIDSNGAIEYRSGSQVLSDIGGTQSTFDGNRGITQTLLPSLLNFNPGTTSVEDFLDAVFYPPSPEDFSILSNEPFSVLESDEEDDIIHASTTGYSGQQAAFSIDTSATITWSLQSTTIFNIDSTTGELDLNTDLSGSATFQAPKTLTGTVVATSNGGTIKTAPFTVTVVPNAAPTITFQTQTRNNNKTTGATGFGAIVITDLPQGVDTVSIDELNGADASSFSINSPTPGVTTTYILSSSVALNSGSYSLEVTGSDSYDSTVSASFTLTVEENLPPVIVQTGFSVETDQATSGSNVGTITVSDPQDDSIASLTFTGTDAALFNAIEVSSTATSKTFNIQPTSNLTAGSFNITGSGTDSFGLTTLEPIENEFTLPVPEAPEANGIFYIIESAESGSFVFTNSNGFSGTKALFTSDQSGTWSIQSSNILAINQLGELSIEQHLSGSTTQAPGTLTGTVRLLNNDGQSSTSPISVTLVENLPATITPSLTLNYNEAETDGAIGLGTITVADPQAYENVEITDSTGQNIVISTETAAQSVVYEVSSSGALTQGSYTLQVTASDSYGHDTEELFTFTVAENLAPTVTPSGFTKTLATALSGSVYGTIVAADPQTDSIASFSITGTDAALFNAIEVSSTASSKTFEIEPLNDLTGGSYNISGSARDSFGLETTSSIANNVSVPVPNAATTTTPLSIIESALSESIIRASSNGITGAHGQLSTDQSVVWEVVNSNFVEIDQLGRLSLKAHLSGSQVYQAPGPLPATVKVTNTYGQSATNTINISIIDNVAATISNNVATSKKEADTTSAIGMGTVVIADPQNYENVQWIDFDGGGNFVTSSETPGQSVTYEVSSSGALTNGTYTFAITASDSYGQLTKELHTLVVSENQAPTISYSGFNVTDTAATSGSTIGTATAVDPDAEGIASFALSGTDASSFNAILASSNSNQSVFNIQPNTNLSAGSYNITGSATDDFGLTTAKAIPNTVTTAGADPIQKNGNLFIIESAESGSHITTSTDGIPGTQVQFTTATAGVTWSVSPTTYLHIDTTGKLSLQAHVSGVLDDTNTIDATVTAGTGASPETTLQISVDITPNLGPSVTDTVASNVQDSDAEAGDTLGTILAIDPQALDAINSITITGGASQSEVTLGTFSQTTNSGSVDLLVGGSNMAAGAKAVEVTATDSFGQETVHNINFSVGATPATKVFVYTNTVNAANLNGTTTQALTALGALYYADYDFADAGYALAQLQAASDFAQDFTATGTTYGSGVLDFIASGSIDDLLDMQTFGNIPTSTTGKQVVYLFPSSSDMSSLPSTIAAVADLNNIPSGQHALVSYAQTPPVSPTGDVFYFETDNPVHGYSDWGIAFTLDRQTGTNRWAIAASGDTIPS